MPGHAGCMSPTDWGGLGPTPDVPEDVNVYRAPLGSPDAILYGWGPQSVVIADPETPDELVGALVMAGRALAAGDTPEAHVGRPPEPLVGLIPHQLPGVIRQEFGLPIGNDSRTSN